jgi:hypothetical protein
MDWTLPVLTYLRRLESDWSGALVLSARLGQRRAQQERQCRVRCFHPALNKSSKACQRLLLLNTMTAKVRLMNNHLKLTPGFAYIFFDPEDLHAISLEDFLPHATVGRLLR